MKSKLSIYPRISCSYLILLRFSSSLSMAKRTVEVKLPSVCPRRHSNPVLFVPLKPYVLVASGSTPSQIKPQAHQWVLWLGPHCSQLFGVACLLTSFQPDQVYMFSSPDLPGRYAVLKIIIKSTFLFNFFKFVYVKNHVDTLGYP